MTININGKWRLYWGAMPLPEGAVCYGTVTRDGLDTGALIHLASGQLVQGNAGTIRTLHQGRARTALAPHHSGPIPDKPVTPAGQEGGVR